MRHVIKSSLKFVLALSTVLSCVTLSPFAVAQEATKALTQTRPWMDPAQSSSTRAKLLLAEMTQDEKLRLVFGYFGAEAPWENYLPPKEAIPHSSGYVPGIDRLGIPPQWQTDAGSGVGSMITEHPRERTALPSSLATAATWNPDLAFQSGAMIGNEAYLSGFNVQLAGGVNLMRDPRNGRNFEYAGEDPYLAGLMTGRFVAGIQSNPVMSTLKHFAFNDQETVRTTLDVKIDDKAGRMSDLLAFQFAIEFGNPASIMCAYNRVGGVYACENDYLLNQVLKTDWGYKGFVMSDWGGTHSTTQAAQAGLDQSNGHPFAASPYFKDALKEAVVDHLVSESQLDNMVGRILYAMFENRLFDTPTAGNQEARIDFTAHDRIAQSDAEEAIVLLKNDHNLLPLAKRAKKILVVGGHADKGVLSGGGSAQVYARGGSPVANEGPTEFPGPIVYYADAPVDALRARTKADIIYLEGNDIKAAQKAARSADIVIVFATQWLAERLDAPSLDLPNNQNALISALAGPKTVVVLETGGPVAMPWANRVGAIVEAWYPGSRGGTAIARILTGEANPSGHLPATFPINERQLPRHKIEGDNDHPETRITVDYTIEGAAVGYKWFDLKNLAPAYPFGHGLSYATFTLSDLNVTPEAKTVKVSLNVTNTSKVDGKEVAQVYAAPVSGGWEAPKRLVGFAKLDLKAGDSKAARFSVDPRLLADYDPISKTWVIHEGTYRFMLARSATEITETLDVKLPETHLDLNGR